MQKKFHIRRTNKRLPQSKFKGKVQPIDQLPGLIIKFKKAINYQQKELREEFKRKEFSGSKGNFELSVYQNLFDIIKKLMYNESWKLKKNLVSMISSENRFKAFLDGLFTGLSDLDKDRVIAVLVEFQVGGGGRVDIMVQVVDNENPDEEGKIEELEESISVGFELKYSKTVKGGN